MSLKRKETTTVRKFKRLSRVMLSQILAFSLTATACAAVEDTGYSDVDANAWYAEAVQYCRENDLMIGTGENQFEPESSLTRAQLAAVLYRIESTPAVTGADDFTDTPDNTWYSDAVLWITRQSLMSGYGDGLFGPDDPVTREQMTAILWRRAAPQRALRPTATLPRSQGMPPRLRHGRMKTRLCSPFPMTCSPPNRARPVPRLPTR